MMVFVLRHNAPAAPIAPVAHHTASVAFAPPLALPILNARAISRIVTAALAAQIKLVPPTLNARAKFHIV